jgi:beta-xylosidase/lysophospholipase L1-like esterase
MKKLLSIIATVVVSVCLMSSSRRPVHIFMAGDSTMADKVYYKNVTDGATGDLMPVPFMERGWGMYVQELFGSNATVKNIARNGRSSRTFIQGGLWKQILDKLQKGDYVIIQFGHNDDVPTKKSATTPDEFRRYITQYVDEARAKGATPILCTPVQRRNFVNGKLEDTHGVYPDVIRSVAKEKQVAMIDLQKSTSDWLSAEGEPATRQYFHKYAEGINPLYPKGLDDNTHFVEKGARKVAEMFAEGLKEQKISGLTSLLKENEKPYVSDVWVSDLGNGRYKNPVLYADYSDPDVCRAGDDYYMTASSFANAPFLPVLHSKDLVNWTIIGHAGAKFSDRRFDSMQHGNGVWAPAIRYHNGEFYICYGDPDAGIYITKAKKPEGPWSELHLIKAGTGLIDACPFWDSDGRAYIAHAYAGSRAGMKSLLAVFEMTPDATKALTESRIVFDGHEKHPTVEGAKFYKRNGYYYIFAPAGGVKPGWQLILRSENIYGPYEEKIALVRGKTDINGPHQGAWVTTPDGKEDWFLHFQDVYAYGRVVHMQPMKWINDFPVIGEDRDGDGCGEPVMTFKKPNVGKTYPVATPAESDEFDSPVLGLQWQWQANPNPLWYFPMPDRSSLRLYAWQIFPEYKNLWGAPHLLMQKLPALDFKATTKFTFSPSREGERAGLVIMGMDYAAISLQKTGSGFAINQTVCIDADKAKEETVSESINTTVSTLYFRVEVKSKKIKNRDNILQPHAYCTFSYSEDGKKFTSIGKEFEAREGKWIGAKAGIFCERPKHINDSGYMDVDWFRIEK